MSTYSYYYKASLVGTNGIAYRTTPWDGGDSGTYYLGASMSRWWNMYDQYPIVIDEYLTGWLDDVIWFDKVMSASELTEIRNQTYDPSVPTTGQVMRINMD